MPVRIIRRSEAVPPQAAPTPTDKPAQSIAPVKSKITIHKASARAPVSTHSRGWEVGGGIVLHKFDLVPEKGHTKFVLHKIKDKVWYRVREFEEDTRLISLTSQVEFEFACRAEATVHTNYVVAIYPGVVREPSIEMLTFVNRKLPTLLQTSAPQAVAA